MSLVGRKPLPTIIESAGIRYNPETDYVEILNPNTDEWEQWEKTGVAIEACTIVVSTRNLNGQTATCVIGGVTYTSIFVGGACTFKVNEVGTATITCAGYTTTVTTVSGGYVTVELTRPSATLKLTTENLNGETVTVKIAGVTYTGTFTNKETAFTIYEVGTATITCGVVTETCEIESGKTYTVDVTRDYATLNFTTSDLNGKSISVTVGGQTYTGVFSSNKCTIVVYTFGSATITCAYASTTQTIAVGGSYTVTLNRPYATLNLTTTNLNGHTVTVTCGGNTYTGTFASGTCTIKIYDVFGTATITSTGVSTTQAVVSGGSYTVAMTRPFATLNLTTENLDGYAVNVSVGGTNYSGTFASGKCTIIVYTFGTATITSSETTVTQAVASGGTYTVDITEETTLYLVRDGNYETNLTFNYSLSKVDNALYLGNMDEGIKTFSFNISSLFTNVNEAIGKKITAVFTSAGSLNAVKLNYYNGGAKIQNFSYSSLVMTTTIPTITVLQPLVIQILVEDYGNVTLKDMYIE